MTTKTLQTNLLAALLATGSVTAQADDFAIGEPVDINGMEVAAVYLQPTTMAPMLPGMVALADIHLEADIQALEGNRQGFAAGDWIPYLQISYQIRKQDSDWSTIGTFMPMVASDGPHYAANIKLDGPGKYRLDYHIVAPQVNGFFRHTDRETGVEPWWAPVDLSWEFTYLGTGKKGGY